MTCFALVEHNETLNQHIDRMKEYRVRCYYTTAVP